MSILAIGCIIETVTTLPVGCQSVCVLHGNNQSTEAVASLETFFVDFFVNFFMHSCLDLSYVGLNINGVIFAKIIHNISVILTHTLKLKGKNCPFSFFNR